MHYSAYVGRVGALAVALGIGSAVTGVQVAWADPAGSGTSHGGAGSTRSGSASHARGAAKNSGAHDTHKRRTTAATGTHTPPQTAGAAKDSTATSSADSTADSRIDAGRHRTPRRAARAGTDSATGTPTDNPASTTTGTTQAAAVAATTDTTVKSEVAQDTVTVTADQTAEVSTAIKAATDEYVAVKTEAETADADEYVVVVADGKTEVVPKDTTIYIKENDTEYTVTDPVKTETDTYVKTEDGNAIKDTTNESTSYEYGESHSGQTTTDDNTTTIYHPEDPAGESPASTQTATVSVSSVTPSGVAVRPVHNLVLGVLGLFGFHPGTGAWTNPILAGIWGTYRRIEAFFDNAEPRIVSAQVVSTSMTTDGRTAVTLAVSATDLDGDTLRYSTKSGAHGTLTANADGTFTYVADTGYTGTDTVTITANDAGHFHFHGLLSIFEPNWGHTSTAKLKLTLTNDSTPAAAVTTIDSVSSTPGTGNSWTVAVVAHSSDESPILKYTLTATDPDHVTVSATGASGVYTVTVDDASWAAANGGTTINVRAIVDGGSNQAVSGTVAIGTVSNATDFDLGTLDSAAIPALPTGVTYTGGASTGFTIDLLTADGGSLRVANSADNVPLPVDSYVAIKRSSAGDIVLLRSDGEAIQVSTDGQSRVIVGPGEGAAVITPIKTSAEIYVDAPLEDGGYKMRFVWEYSGTIDIDWGEVTDWSKPEFSVVVDSPLQLLSSDGSVLAAW